jgi:putative ABC transport system substrate-binding protein
MLAATAGTSAYAQQPLKAWRIGTLVTGSGSLNATAMADLRRALDELGYVDGKNVRIVERSADGAVERLPKLAGELVALGVDLIVTTGSEATRAAKRATATIPIVFSGPSYPVEEGLVASFARPGGNVTGITVAMSDTITKHLQLLRDVTPTLARVAVIWSPANPGHTFAFRDTQNAAASLRIHIDSVPLTGASDIVPALAAVERLRPDALIVQPTPYLNYEIRRIGELAVKLRIPSISIGRTFTQEGLLMSYGADFRDAPRRVARYVDRILKGAKPADLPVERPTKFHLVINMKTAKALGLAIPQPLVLRADEVIE